MKITVYNIKGGAGKTDISLNLALTMGLAIVTNEPFSPLEKVLDDNRFIKLDHDEELPKIPDEYDVVFDLGGYLDGRAINALKQSGCVIVPVVNEFKDVHTTINFIQEIEEYNNNIIVVANKTQKGDFDNVKAVIKQHYPNYPVLEIKQSRALPNIMKEKKSIGEMAGEGGLKTYFYKPVAKQFEKLINTINSIKIK